MSIMQLLESESFFTFLFLSLLFGLIFYIPIKFAIGKKIQDDIYGGEENEEKEKKEEKNAKIVARRTIPHPLFKRTVFNTVIFELSDGSRLRLGIKKQNLFDIMVEGDYGTLRHQGKKFISFIRNSKEEI